MSQEFVSLVVKNVCESKKIKNADPTYVKKIVLRELKRYPQLLKLASAKTVDKRIVKRGSVKQFVKKVRGVIFNTYGVFQSTKIDKRDDILRKLRKVSQKDFLALCDVLLMLHSSSRERLQDYSKIYEKIFSLTGKPKTILDIGCGMNPVSFYFMKLSKLDYTAVELNKEDTLFLRGFFEEVHRRYKGLCFHSESLDVTDEESLRKIHSLGSFDVCFLWKMSDVVETKKGHKQFEQLLTSVNSKYLVVSFPTRTISDKKMAQPRRMWFEIMIKRCGFSSQRINTRNELFYVISKDL